MKTDLIWQQNNAGADNRENLEVIAAWWSDLHGKEVIWQQRLIPASEDLQDIDWQPQQFHKKLVLNYAQLKGITIYWQEGNSDIERNITAGKLRLDTTEQKLYIYPQSQSQVVICVTLPGIVYQKIELNNPLAVATSKGDKYLLLLRDKEQKLELKITLDRAKMQQLFDSLNLSS
ncbi:MAG: hypothetical protein ACFCU5_12920 [Pleurocapsa sp.]